MEPTNPAGGRSFPVNGVSVSGVLIVNVDAMAQDHGGSRPASGFGEGTTWGRVFLHELGHLVGLGRVAGQTGNDQKLHIMCRVMSWA